MTASGIDVVDGGFAGFLRRYPLTSYFAIALAFSWLVVLVILSTGKPVNFVGIVGITLGPTVAGFTMTAVVEGRAGVQRLFRRFVLWRVGWVWYLFVFVGIPLIFILGTVFLPGAAASFDPLSAERWLGYPKLFVLVLLVGGPLFEEPGWRGFALPRLEAKFGPLAGTVILGLLWAAWHYPQYLMPDWAIQNGGFNLPAIAVYTLGVVPLAIILTLVFNNTKGSLLLAILAHASINTFSVYVTMLFPAYAASLVNLFAGVGTFAVLAILLTRGSLGYDRYLRETQPV